MKLQAKKSKALVGLDIEAGSVAAAEVSANGSVTVTRHGVVPLPPGAVREGEVADVDAVAAAMKRLFTEHKLARAVRVGVANQRVAVRTLRLPPIESASELETAVRFQAQDHIPMPLEQAVLDWQVLGHTDGADDAAGLDVVAVAARRDMLSGLMAALRKAGLRPEGIDLAAFGMIRALGRSAHAPVGASAYVDAPTAAPTLEAETEVLDDAGEAEVGAGVPAPAKLYCSLGDVTNLAVASGMRCLFTRTSPFGIEGIAQKLAERQSLNLDHARQWLVHVGLEEPVGSIEGDPKIVEAARDTLAQGVSRLADELRVSLEYYRSQEAAAAVEGVVACGPGTTIPGLLERLQGELGQPFELGRPAELAAFGDPLAARLTVAYGLGLEE